jgi:hypothetical protein
MQRETHPEAYDWLIICGDTPQEIEGYIDSYAIGIYHAHADLRKAGKLPASAMLNEPSTITEELYPKLGPFYCYRNSIIAPDEYQRRIDPVTFIVESVVSSVLGSPKEHRDMWDNYMLVKYPELKTLYDDDHKALPRGRVDYSKKGGCLSFFVTLDRCIQGMEDEIKKIYNLGAYPVEFPYGSMNYKCKNCR